MSSYYLLRAAIGAATIISAVSQAMQNQTDSKNEVGDDTFLNVGLILTASTCIGLVASAVGCGSQLINCYRERKAAAQKAREQKAAQETGFPSTLRRNPSVYYEQVQDNRKAATDTPALAPYSTLKMDPSPIIPSRETIFEPYNPLEIELENEINSIINQRPPARPPAPLPPNAAAANHHYERDTDIDTPVLFTNV